MRRLYVIGFKVVAKRDSARSRACRVNNETHIGDDRDDWAFL